jgi:hypothetical protein
VLGLFARWGPHDHHPSATLRDTRGDHLVRETHIELARIDEGREVLADLQAGRVLVRDERPRKAAHVVAPPRVLEGHVRIRRKRWRTSA